MSWLFNFVYVVVLVVASPWLVLTSWRTGKYREGFRAKLLGLVPVRVDRRPCVWLHAVSVGEVNLLAGVLVEIQRRWPDTSFTITTTTKSGYELAKTKYDEHHVCYCPLDFSWAVDKAMLRIRPHVLVLAELELWPNLISAAKRRNVPVVVINGRLSEASFLGYRRIRSVMNRTLRHLTSVAVQNQEYAERFIALGLPRERVHVTGSIKFDNAQTDRDNSQTVALRQCVGLNASDLVFLAGSTQAPEEALALATFRQLQPCFPSLRLIVVPRHAERFEAVHQVLADGNCRYMRRSEATEPTDAEAWQVLLVDTVGELAAWWGTADVAFVGGSLGNRGGQNMIEPAAFGAAVCFGPNTRNFRDVVSMLLAHDAAQVVTNGTELTEFVAKCLSGSTDSLNMGHRAQQLVAAQRGATKRTVDLLEPLLPLNLDRPAP